MEIVNSQFVIEEKEVFSRFYSISFYAQNVEKIECQSGGAKNGSIDINKVK